MQAGGERRARERRRDTEIRRGKKEGRGPEKDGGRFEAGKGEKDIRRVEGRKKLVTIRGLTDALRVIPRKGGDGRCRSGFL